MNKAVSMRTIAREAGVSVMTVSRVLNDEKNVNEEKCRLIKEVASRLGYQRNLLVSTVMSSMHGNKKPLCSHVIAYLTVHSSHFTPEMVLPSRRYFEGARDRAAENGFEVEIFEIKPPEMDCSRISKILRARNIEGLLVGPLCRGCGHLSLKWNTFVSSAISLNLVKPDLNRCSVDVLQSMSVTLRNLRRLGYRRIGLALPPFYEALNHHRSRAAYLNHGYDAKRWEQLRPLSEWSLEGVANWLVKEQPDAIIGHGTELLAWLNVLGLRIPGDIGYAELELIEHTNPPTAGVAFDLRSVGAAAANLVITDLLRSANGVPTHPLHIYLQGEWKEGPSVRKQSTGEQKALPAYVTALAEKVKDLSALQNRPEDTFPLTQEAEPRHWRPISLTKRATHSLRRRGDINAWEQGLGLPLPQTQLKCCGVPFQLVDESTNQGRAYVLLRQGTKLTLSVNQGCRALYFLMACGWVTQHGPVANLCFNLANGESLSEPIIAYYKNPDSDEDTADWEGESGVQDWWPSFPLFANERARPYKVTGYRGDPADWRYLYCFQWKNPNPEIDVQSLILAHNAPSGTSLALLAVQSLKIEQ